RGGLCWRRAPCFQPALVVRCLGDFLSNLRGRATPANGISCSPSSSVETRRHCPLVVTTPARGFVGLPAAETTTHVPRLREPCTSTISPTASLFNDSIIARRRNRFRDREAAVSALDSS